MDDAGVDRLLLSDKKFMKDIIAQPDALSIIFESTHMLVAYLDKDLRFVKVNKAYAKADDKEPDEFIGKRHFDLYPNEENERLFQRVIDTGEPYISYAKPFEYEGHPERGVTHWDWSLIPSKNECGEVTGAVLQLINVTERIEAEEKLRIEQDFGSAVLAAANALVVVLSSNGKIKRFNTACEKVTGYSFEEVHDKYVWDFLITEEEIEPVREVFQNLADTALPSQFTNYWVAKDGSKRLIDWNNSTMFDEDGKVRYVLSVGVDVTDRARAEKELLESNQFNASVISALPIGVAMYDESGQCVMVNNWVAKDVGATREQLLAQNFHDIASWKGSGMYEAAIKAIETDSMQRVQSEHVTSFGNEVAFDAWFQPIFIGEKKHLLVMLKDISERRRDEKRIRNQAQIIDQIHDSVITTDLDGYIVTWNKGAERIFGYTAEEAAGKHISLIYPESELETMQNEIINPLVEKGAHETESLMQRKNGELFTGHLSLSFLTDDQGKRIRMIGYTMDISDRIKVEQDLKRKEKTLSEAQAIAHVGNWQWNIEDGGIEWSDEIYRIYDYEPGSFKPTYETFMKSIHEEDRESVQEAINASLADPVKNYQVQHRIVTAANEIRTVQEDGRIFLDDDGKPARMIGTVKDITELKQANAELEKSRVRFQTIIESSSDAVMLANANRELEVVNKGTIKLFGYSEDELLGNTTSMLYSKEGDYLKVGQEHFNVEAPPAAGPDIYEMRYRRKDGTEFWGETMGAKVVSSNGEINGFVGIIRDITERKNTELELEKYRERLEELVDERTQELRTAQDALVRRERLATLGQLTATVSHELRNPLGAMQPSLFIVKKNADPENEKLQKALDRIDRSIARCDHIIDELLDFTRITDLDLHPVVLDDWLRTVCAEQEIPAGINLKQELGLNGFEVIVDSNRLRRAVINVIENGLQSMLDETGNRVDVEQAELTVFTRDCGENVEIGIRDRGTGIPPEVLPHIFEVLYSTKGFGVGLGMPTVKHIIKQHGGSIQIDSHPGEGTTVTLRLPKNRS
jgi:PAS domain S-box-containing protein